MCPKPKPEYRQLPKDAWRSADNQVAMPHKKNCLIRGLTPELSRDAQRPSGVLHDSATSEAAKRSRLERIVRQMKCSSFERLVRLQVARHLA
jgi:hypothetical protein